MIDDIPTKTKVVELESLLDQIAIKLADISELSTLDEMNADRISHAANHAMLARMMLLNALKF